MSSESNHLYSRGVEGDSCSWFHWVAVFEMMEQPNKSMRVQILIFKRDQFKVSMINLWDSLSLCVVLILCFLQAIMDIKTLVLCISCFIHHTNKHLSLWTEYSTHKAVMIQMHWCKASKELISIEMYHLISNDCRSYLRSSKLSSTLILTLSKSSKRRTLFLTIISHKNYFSCSLFVPFKAMQDGHTL